METYSDHLHRLAKLLDDDFKGNLLAVVKELSATMANLICNIK